MLTRFPYVDGQGLPSGGPGRALIPNRHNLKPTQALPIASQVIGQDLSIELYLNWRLVYRDAYLKDPARYWGLP